MATLKQVARMAGVSPATASLALNNKPVSEKTRLKVISCAKKLGYIPNKIGRTLITGKSHTIELVMMNSKTYANLIKETSLYYYLIQGILTVTDRFEYSLRFDMRNIEEKDLHNFFLYKISDRTIDGIIIIPQFIESYQFSTIFKDQEFPYVFLAPKNNDFQNLNYVDMDNYLGGQIVARKILSSGFSRIMFINGPEMHVDAIEREKGFIDELVSGGITIDKKHIRYGDFTISSGYKVMSELLDLDLPEVVFCANDYMAAGAMRCLSKRGLRIPGDTSVIGYDNTDIAPGLIPPLTSVDNRFEYLGECLASKLIGLINNKIDKIETHVQPLLIERESTV